MWFRCFFPRVHSDLGLFRRELRKKMELWDKKRPNMDGVQPLSDAVTRVMPSLLIRNSMLPVEPSYTTYYNVVMEQMTKLKKIIELRESGVAEVDGMTEEEVEGYLKACVDALSDEKRNGMHTKKKRVLLRHVLEAVREAHVEVDLPRIPTNDEDHCNGCYINSIRVFKR